MVISSGEVLSNGPYEGNGATTVWDFEFTIYAETELTVQKLTASTGAIANLVLNTDYTVTPSGGEYPAAGGTITISPALPVGESIVILPSITRSQDRPFSSQSSITLTEIENALDKLTSLTRELFEIASRAISVSAFSADADLATLTANVQALAAIEAEITAVSAVSADVATISANIAALNTVADNLAAVTAVAARYTEVGIVADRDADIGTVAARDADIGTVADNINDIIAAKPELYEIRNPVINGAFDIAQRGTSHSTTGYGSLDRWRLATSGGTSTASRQNFALGDTLGINAPKHFGRLSASGMSGVSSFSILAQRLEGVRTFAGQTVTVMGWARRSSGAGNMALSLVQAFGTGGSPSADVEVAGSQVALTSSWAPFAVTFNVPSVSGKTLGTNGNDFLQLDIWASAGSDFNARTASLGIQTIGVDLWGVHMLPGTFNTAMVSNYVAPRLDTELIRCQRYYSRCLFNVRFVATAAGQIAENALRWPVTMRAVPAVVTSGGSASIASPSIPTVSTFGARAAITSTTSGDAFVLNMNVDADAEL